MLSNILQLVYQGLMSVVSLLAMVLLRNSKEAFWLKQSAAIATFTFSFTTLLCLVLLGPRGAIIAFNNSLSLDFRSWPSTSEIWLTCSIAIISFAVVAVMKR